MLRTGPRHDGPTPNTASVGTGDGKTESDNAAFIRGWPPHDDNRRALFGPVTGYQTSEPANATDIPRMKSGSMPPALPDRKQGPYLPG